MYFFKAYAESPSNHSSFLKISMSKFSWHCPVKFVMLQSVNCELCRLIQIDLIKENYYSE